MKRREFVRFSGVVAAAWLSAARAQQPVTPVIGFLNSGSPDGYAQLVAAFRQGLNETGYVEGRNVAIEFRWAQAQNDRLSALATELVRRPVAVIAGLNSTAAARAAKAATTTIPIVFVIGADPVEVGLVASLNRPGGNLTGVSFLGNMLVPKRLELLRELVPTADTIAFLVNPINPNAEADTKNAQSAAHAIGRTLFVLNATSERDLETAFAKLAKQRAHALLVNVDPLFISHRGQIILLAARHAIPTIYDRREFVAAGGLMSYGSSLTDVYRQAGIYTGRILKGTKPADLPILQPTKFEMVINLKTAKALGVTIPQSILLRADQVIE
jgi:putative ABC transport system substrate-binding protein